MSDLPSQESIEKSVELLKLAFQSHQLKDFDENEYYFYIVGLLKGSLDVMRKVEGSAFVLDYTRQLLESLEMDEKQSIKH